MRNKGLLQLTLKLVFAITRKSIWAIFQTFPSLPSSAISIDLMTSGISSLFPLFSCASRLGIQPLFGDEPTFSPRKSFGGEHRLIPEQRLDTKPIIPLPLSVVTIDANDYHLAFLPKK